jgi:hypothetical protein
MNGFTLKGQRPPEPRRVNEDVVERFEHVFEVAPEKMTEHIRQQEIPAWDTHRIVSSRWDHLDWMHDHWADSVLSTGIEPEIHELGEAMPSEERAGVRPGPSDPGQRSLDPATAEDVDRVDPSSGGRG